MQYLKYVRSRHDVYCTVIGGIGNQSSINEHKTSKELGNASKTRIQLDEEIHISISQDQFLSNDKNNSQ